MHVFCLAILISVTGAGRASANPDMATESFTISTNAASAAAATSENNDRYNALAARLKTLGIPAADIRTSSFNISYTPPPQAAPGEAMPPVRERYGYFVSRGVNVTLHDLSLVGKAIDGAVLSGVTDIGGVSYGVTQTRPLFLQALASAVADARMQAQRMAEAAGLRLLRVHSMQQGYAATPPPVPMMRAQAAADTYTPTQIQPNAVEENATVTVVFEAQ